MEFDNKQLEKAKQQRSHWLFWYTDFCRWWYELATVYFLFCLLVFFEKHHDRGRKLEILYFYSSQCWPFFKQSCWCFHFETMGYFLLTSLTWYSKKCSDWIDCYVLTEVRNVWHYLELAEKEDWVCVNSSSKFFGHIMLLCENWFGFL